MRTTKVLVSWLVVASPPLPLSQGLQDLVPEGNVFEQMFTGKEVWTR
jgi:hypothetical protein